MVLFGHVKFEMPDRQASGDVEQMVECISLKLRGRSGLRIN